MNKDYNILKKYYGEKFAQLCRDLFPTIIEKEGLLSNIILSKFAPSHFLYEDIIDFSENFKKYIYSLINVEQKVIKTNKSIKELLDEKGYDFYECKTEDDIQFFRKYYAKGEELCTFRGGRLKSCYVFWAVKKDVNMIEREKHPKRDDPYGTSVISIQFTKQGNTLSIKNRYNHTVENPDATFSNNLENINPGLTDAFEREYGLKINQNSNYFELPNYVIANDGKYYKYNYELNNIYYCPDNIIIDNGEVKHLDKSRYIIIDYFIVDLKEKQIKLYDNNINDSFPDSCKDINIIEISKKDINKELIIKSPNKEDVIIEIDKYQRIIGLDNKNLTEVENWFLHSNRCLTKLNLPNLKKTGDNFLLFNSSLLELNLPELKTVGNKFMKNNRYLSKVNLPKLEEVGDCFFYNNSYIIILDLPNLKKVGSSFLERNKKLKYLNIPEIEKAGPYFLLSNEEISKIDVPKLKESGRGFLKSAYKISKLTKLRIKLKDYIHTHSKEKEEKKNKKR